MYMPSISIEDLRKLYQRLQPNSKLIFDYFSNCRSNETVVTVDDLQSFFQKRQYVVARQDIVDFFKALRDVGSW